MFTSSFKDSLPEIEAGLASDERPKRLNAAERLRSFAEAEPKLHREIEAVCRRLLAEETDATITFYAIGALKRVLSPEAFRPVHLKFLETAPPESAAYAINGYVDASHVPVLLSLLERYSPPSSEAERARGLRLAIFYVLGKLKPPEAFELLVKSLDDPNPEIRLGALDALFFLHDPRAIPHLEKLTGDTATVGEYDERSAPRQIGENARFAIARLREPAPKYEDPYAKPPVVPRALLNYLPLIGAILTGPWVIVMVMMNLGYKPNGFTHYEARTFYLGCSLPSLAGLCAAVYVYTRARHPRAVHRVFLHLGAGLCAILTVMFWYAISQQKPPAGWTPPPPPAPPARRINPAQIPRPSAVSQPVFRYRPPVLQSQPGSTTQRSTRPE